MNESIELDPTINARLQPIVDELLTNGITLDQAMPVVERKMIHTALRRTRGNVTRAAHLLGIHRNTLHNKLRQEFEDSKPEPPPKPKRAVRPRRRGWVRS